MVNVTAPQRKAVTLKVLHITLPQTSTQPEGQRSSILIRTVSELSSKLESILASRVDLNYKSCCLDQCFQTSLPTEPQLYFCLCHFKKVTEKATSQLSCFAAEITEIGHRVICLTALFMATCLYIFKSQLQWAIVHLYTVETFVANDSQGILMVQGFLFFYLKN